MEARYMCLLGLNIDFLSQNVQHLNHLLILKKSYLYDFLKGKIFSSEEVEDLLYPYLLLAGGKKNLLSWFGLIHKVLNLPKLKIKGE